MSAATLQLVSKLKEAGQDFEFYPTTAEIILDVKYSIGEGESLLDVGAGRGDVLKAVEDKAGDLYAIEKSQILINELPKGVFIVGSDFHRQTLIDKKVDVIFSNPPYSEFKEWAVKIIKEANAKKILLVLPARWKESKAIAHALDQREATARSIGTYSFKDGDRAARAVVNLVRIDLNHDSYHSRDKLKTDPFRVWFEEHFPEPEPQEKTTKKERDETKKGELAKGRNLIEILEEFYLSELGTLIKSFTDISAIPSALLKKIGVNRADVIGSLQSKIDGLKNRYWKELFDNLDKITDRLTSKSRKSLMDTLFKNTHVDFSASNAYGVVIWAIKNANGYIDGQLIDLYRDLSHPNSATAYKSNRRFADSSWRFGCSWDKKPEVSHYKLDYRIVNEYFNAFGGYSFEPKRNGINETASEKINDLCTVAHTLGFDVMERARSFDWEPGTQEIFYYLDENGEPEEFARIRLYKNGNAHLKLNQDFMLKLNVEAARLLGWITNAGEAAEEMHEPLEKIKRVFNSSFRITLGSVKLLKQSA